jgi:hypothetical protein
VPNCDAQLATDERTWLWTISASGTKPRDSCKLRLARLLFLVAGLGLGLLLLLGDLAALLSAGQAHPDLRHFDESCPRPFTRDGARHFQAVSRKAPIARRGVDIVDFGHCSLRSQAGAQGGSLSHRRLAWAVAGDDQQPSTRMVPGETVIFAGAGLGRCPGLNHERLETNTSMPHIIRATSYGPGEPRVRIPVKRFLACPLHFHRQPRSRGGVSHHPRYRAAGAPRCGRAVSHNRKLIH